MPEEQTIISDYIFWQGKANLTTTKFSREVQCRVFLNASPNQDLCIAVANELGFEALTVIDDDKIAIKFEGAVEPVGLIPKGIKVNSRGEDVVEFGVKRSPICVTKAQQLRSGRTLLINFAYYGLRAPQHLGFELKASGWKACFIPISAETLAVKVGLQSEVYRITHQVEYAREDGKVFTPQQAQDFLDNLHIFLSFCRGQWVAMSFSIALDENGDVGMEHWGTGKVSRWRRPSSWLDEHHGSSVVELFEPFYVKLADRPWRDAISQIVYWFERAENDAAGVDGACILLQASLERFAWHFLVYERRVLSKNAFGELGVAGRLRLMLITLGIPTAIPPGLRQLHNYEEQEAWMDLENSSAFVIN